MKQSLLISICGIAATLLISECNRMPTGGIPIYVKIDSASVASDGGLYGSSSCRLADVWVTNANTDLGAYEMPTLFPVLASGDVRMLVSGGIYDNGIISSRAEYPFYKPDTFTIYGAVAGQTYTHNPQYHYFEQTKFAIKQDFEQATGFDNMTITNDGYEGKGGVISMGLSDTVTLSFQTDTPVINTNGRQAYVEMNYHMSDSVSMRCKVGVAAINSAGITTYYTLSDLNPTGHWKKIYFNFSQWIGQNAGSKFQVYFSVSKDVGHSGSMYVDNVKLLYFD
ncbi:MAG: hypothetical protein JST76_03760 [Bacteroidetes bacterium]|nr:hypothetical protein [Bacteroidota bacterium]